MGRSWYFDRGADLQELVNLGRVDVGEAPVVVHMGRGDKIVGVYAPPQRSLQVHEALDTFTWYDSVGWAVQIELGAWRLLVWKNWQNLAHSPERISKLWNISGNGEDITSILYEKTSYLFCMHQERKNEYIESIWKRDESTMSLWNQIGNNTSKKRRKQWHYEINYMKQPLFSHKQWVYFF